MLPICHDIEQMMGRPIRSPKDFDLLRDNIYNRLRVNISSHTLKRLWGYLDSPSEPRQGTLDVLARFIGYSDYEAYVAAVSADGGEASSPGISRHINVQQMLSENDELLLSWAPNRQCRVRYLGSLQFQVVESVNTRLRPGDYFQCGLIIEGEPLYLSNLLQPGRLAANYVCGKRGGIRFER